MERLRVDGYEERLAGDQAMRALDRRLRGRSGEGDAQLRQQLRSVARRPGEGKVDRADMQALVVQTDRLARDGDAAELLDPGDLALLSVAFGVRLTVHVLDLDDRAHEPDVLHVGDRRRGDLVPLYRVRRCRRSLRE